MTAARVATVLERLPPGTSEIYFHPAARRDAELDRLMPGYEHEAELAALLDPAISGLLAGRGRTWRDVEPA